MQMKRKQPVHKRKLLQPRRKQQKKRVQVHKRRLNPKNQKNQKNQKKYGISKLKYMISQENLAVSKGLNLCTTKIKDVLVT